MGKFFWGFVGSLLFNISIAALMINLGEKKLYSIDLMGIFFYVILASIGFAFALSTFTKKESLV